MCTSVMEKESESLMTFTVALSLLHYKIVSHISKLASTQNTCDTSSLKQWASLINKETGYLQVDKTLFLFW